MAPNVYTLVFAVVFAVLGLAVPPGGSPPPDAEAAVSVFAACPLSCVALGVVVVAGEVLSFRLGGGAT